MNCLASSQKSLETMIENSESTKKLLTAPEGGESKLDSSTTAKLKNLSERYKLLNELGVGGMGSDDFFCRRVYRIHETLITHGFASVWNDGAARLRVGRHMSV